MGKLREKRWIVPLVLLAIIASASYFRWEVLDERAVGDEVVKRERETGGRMKFGSSVIPSMVSL